MSLEKTGGNWREMKFPPGWKLRKRGSGPPSKSHKLCSRYKRQHGPQSVLDICSWSFLVLSLHFFIARAIKVLNSHAKCHQTPPVPFQKWYLHLCSWATVCSAKVNRRGKRSRFSFSLLPLLDGRNDLINNADLMYKIKYNRFSH